MQRDEDDIEELPEGLVRELRSTEERVPLITGRVDRELLRSARAQFARRRPLWRRPPAWAAVAAAVLLAVFVLPNYPPAPQSPRHADISDVLRLARARAGDPAAQADIDAFAMRIVALDHEGDRS